MGLRDRLFKMCARSTFVTRDTQLQLVQTRRSARTIFIPAIRFSSNSCGGNIGLHIKQYVQGPRHSPVRLRRAVRRQLLASP
jgi:hypothetical protein